MSSYYNDGRRDEEYAVAVSAAAYAINSLESGRRDQEIRNNNSAGKSRPRRPENGSYSNSAGIVERAFTSMKRPTTTSDSVSNGDRRRWEKTKSKKRDTERLKPILIPSPSPILPPRIPPQPWDEFQETEADFWERDELNKIRAKYEKLNASIREWEEMKKKKAKSKLIASESQGERRRVKALQQYEKQMDSVRRIVEGARKQAKVKRRNEELKVKDKASKYRATGRRPATCLCF